MTGLIFLYREILKTSGAYDLAVFSMIKDVDQIITLQEEFWKIAEISKTQIFLNKPFDKFPGYKQYISTF